MLFFGSLLTWYPALPDSYSIPVFFGLIFGCFLLSQVSSRYKVKIIVYPDYLIIRQWRLMFIFRQAERRVTFDMIQSYKNAGNSFKLRLNDKTKYNLCAKRFIFGIRGMLEEFAADFCSRYREYLSGNSITPPQFSAVPVTRPAFPKPAKMNIGEEVVTSRSAMFYFSIIIGFVFLGAMGTGLIFMAVDEKSIFMALFGIAIYLVTYYLISRYYRNAPVVRVSQAGISFNKKSYVWDEVQTIVLTGSQPFNIVGGNDMEGAKIELTDGETRYLLDGLYSNLRQIRSFIQLNFPDKVTASVQQEETAPTAVQAELTPLPIMRAYTAPTGSMQYVKGNPYTTFSAILMWAMLGCFVGGSAYFAEDTIEFVSMLLVFFIPMAGLYLIITMRLNHFGVSDQYLLVKNVYQPWKRKEYQFANIREVVLASNHQGDNTLRLILHDYRTKEYLATGLRNADWVELMTLLKAYNVPLKDENDFVLWSTPEMKKVNRHIKWFVVLYFVVCIFSYMGIMYLDVSENAMIILKICWVLFIILALFGMMFLIARQGKKDMEKTE